MTPSLMVVALVVGTGAVAALAAGEPRLGLVGLAVALLGATLLSDPLPSPAVLGVRLTAALLAVAILRAVSPAPAGRRDDEDHDEVRWHLGWPAAAVVGAAGAAAGLAIAASMPAFPGIALGVGCGLLALAIPAAATERLGPRGAAAVLLLLQGTILLRVGLAGAPSLLEEIVLGSLVIAVAAAAGLLVSASQVGAEGGTHQA